MGPGIPEHMSGGPGGGDGKRSKALLVLSVLGLLLGCGNEKAVDLTHSTRTLCSEYVGLPEDDQEVVLRELLVEQGVEANRLVLDVGRVNLEGFCTAHPNRSVRELYAEEAGEGTETKVTPP